MQALAQDKKDLAPPKKYSQKLVEGGARPSWLWGRRAFRLSDTRRQGCLRAPQAAKPVLHSLLEAFQ